MVTTEIPKKSETCLLSIVVPVFNEQQAIPIFIDHVIPVLEGVSQEYEIIFVNDGSSDSSWAVLTELHLKNNKIKLINLSRNFGKEFALTAGLDFSSGQAVIPIDVDLQDPPHVIVELVEKWREGFDVVLAKRNDRSSDTMIKRWTSNAFYRVFSAMSNIDVPSNAGDFRLLDRAVVNALKNLPERTRFMKGIFAWLGFKQATVYYKRQVRSAGETKWKYWRLWNFALEGIFSFSSLPLRMWTYIGFSISFLTFAYTIFIIAKTLIYGIDVPGYASLSVIMLFGIGLNMIALGVFGEYLGRIFIEVKQRPLYIIKDTLGISKDAG